ncbi:16S rRNA (guanine(966)-N(2))-methyltransferase RsmD [Mucilaginibacter ginkgonis]|uniref:16S rRNA (Guanine(966)-N(2))-methyltransferase RsmD n=1 Tax=Mucilaginibacter ginkgonis TaxID=2682091 RepID=A0A6I4HVE8_9SPHI|nr:16S rRNA (guanine(966)-N(2))-methyltransferase RsmD [Mucilaginibacter ginkgonis]QQL50396.1 16S rRNA (guanine(966)-N(2))-methyltransferase RsmD [Mucilaginibacter ginkgonis]
MRIIGGKLKGLRLNPPANLPVRPTTDLAKEALFNILQNQIELEGITVLDLFSGTGNVALEFASRYAESVLCIDRAFGCVKYVTEVAAQHKLDQLTTRKSDVFKYLAQQTDKYDLIFADPPYDLSRIPEIAKIVFDRDFLNPDGLLIIEHQSMQNLSNHPAFVEQRRYGHSSFSFFRNGN